MSDKLQDPSRQMTDDLSERIRAFHLELIETFGLKAVRFRVGYGGGSGLERSKKNVDGVTKIHIKTRNLDLEFEKDETE